jgi:hypothetical protein
MPQQHGESEYTAQKGSEEIEERAPDDSPRGSAASESSTSNRGIGTDGKQGPSWNVPPGGIVTTGAGYLRRTRPDTYHHRWSRVPVGPVAAQELSKGLNERDHLILVFAEHLKVVTVEQLSRVFFDSTVTARNRIRLLRERRFLASPEVDHHVVSAAVGHRAGSHNAPLVLDWNGKYLLERLHYDLRTWDPATVAQVSSQFGHTLCVSELWSYMVAAARATHGYVHGPGHDDSRDGDTEGNKQTEQDTDQDDSQAEAVGEQDGVRDQVAVGVLNERESTVFYEGCTGWSLELGWAEAKEAGSGTGAETRDERSKRWKYKVLLRPDATLMLSITSNEIEQDYQRVARLSNSKPPASYRGNWFDSLMPTVPSPRAMQAEERMTQVRFKRIFVEAETGSNSSKDVVHKIGRYNHLYSRLTEGDILHGRSWHALFGDTFPVILLVVRDQRQFDTQVALWKTHYAGKSPGALIVVNMESLAWAYAHGRSELLTAKHWLDVMRSDGPKWRSLSDILGLRV